MIIIQQDFLRDFFSFSNHFTVIYAFCLFAEVNGFCGEVSGLACTAKTISAAQPFPDLPADDRVEVVMF